MDVAAFNNQALQNIASSGRCDGCPLEGAKRVGMDMSGSNVGARTIMFMGLNPGREEALQGLPFVGKSGRFLRQCMADAEIGDWAIVNSILCSTNNENEIPLPEVCRSHCRPNVAVFVKLIRPKVIVPCGNGAGALFGMGKGITATSKQIFISRGPTGRALPTLVMPLIHPSSLIRNGGRNAASYPDFMKRLRSIQEAARKFEPDAPGYNLSEAPTQLF